MSDATDRTTTAADEEAAFAELVGGAAGAEGGEPGAPASAEPPESSDQSGASAPEPAPTAARSSGREQAPANGHVDLEDPALQAELDEALRVAARLPREITQRFIARDRLIKSRREDQEEIKARNIAEQISGIDGDGEASQGPPPPAGGARTVIDIDDSREPTTPRTPHPPAPAPTQIRTPQDRVDREDLEGLQARLAEIDRRQKRGRASMLAAALLPKSLQGKSAARKRRKKEAEKGGEPTAD